MKYSRALQIENAVYRGEQIAVESIPTRYVAPPPPVARPAHVRAVEPVGRSDGFELIPWEYIVSPAERSLVASKYRAGVGVQALVRQSKRNEATIYRIRDAA